MIQLKLTFKKDEKHKEFEITDGELLSEELERVLVDVPKSKFENHEIFNVLVNGNLIEKDFWPKVKLKTEDTVIITPKIGGGDAGQLFKQALIIVVAAVASVYLGPAAGGGIYGALAVAAVTIGATLVLNALIPPPVPETGALGGFGDIDSSQMYSINGQSNQAKRLGIVPKVYGSHRIYPTLAVTPYTEIAVSPGVAAHRFIQDLSYVAKDVGPAGNKITVRYINGATAGSEIVSVSGKNITVTIESGVSTAAQIRTKIAAHSTAKGLVNASLSGTGNEPQTINPQVSFAGGEEPGETVQYLYSIYDFGLGTPQISELKIGDTPLSTDSFADFDYRFVDINKNEVDNDEFDSFLEPDFKYYANKRTVSQLAVSLFDGDENIQLSDVNDDSVDQEIILDFVAPNGLFGFTNSGSTVKRSVKMYIQFALVGSSDWKDYNDTMFVESHSAVGGNDITEFLQFVDPTVDATYYSTFAYYNSGTYNSSDKNQQITYYIKPNQKKLLVPEDPRFEVGAKVYIGKRFLGIIESVVDLGVTYELTLDRIMTTRGDIQAYTRGGFGSFGGSPSYGGANNVAQLRVSRHEAGAAVISGDRQAPVYGQFRFTPKEVGQYQVRVRRVESIGSYGSQKADNLTWGALTTSFKSPPIRTDKRHVFLELRIKATNQLNGHIQNLSGVASSVLPVYDPDTQIWTRQVTNNPAWIFCDLLTGEVNRKSVPISRLHLESIVAWADFCDEVPTPPDGYDYLEPRFQCNFILDYDTTLQALLAQIGGAAQASLNIIDGQYGVMVDRFKDTPVQIFTPRNSRDFSSTRIYSTRPHAVKVKFIDPNLGWEVQETLAYDNGFNEDNATDFDELTSFACTNYEQAWRFGRYMIAQNKLRQETINVLVDFENIICTRGDYVQITQDVMRVGGTPARIKSVSGITVVTDDSLDIDPGLNYGYVFRNSDTGEILTSTLTPTASNTFDVDGVIPAVGDLIIIGEVGSIVYDCIVKSISPNDDMSANITLVEKADAIFDYESETDLPEYDPQISATSAPEFKPPLAVTDLVLGDNFWECSITQSGYNYYAEIVWEMPPGSVFEYFEIWTNDGRGYTLNNTTSAKYFKFNVDQTRLGIEHGIKVAAISASGKKLQLIEMPEITFTPEEKSTPPSDVASLNMSITNQVLQLSWPSILDCDVARYQVRFSPDTNDKWEASIPLQEVDRNVNSISVQARTGVYFVKAFDFNDNQSANAALAITTIPNLFDLNIVELLNDAPDFNGTLEQTELIGEAVILQVETPGDVETMQYYDGGNYVSENLLDLDDVYTVRLQSQIRADGYKFGELMSDWDALEDVEHLNTSSSDDWDVQVEYRATDVFAAMSDWPSLDVIDHINYGAGVGFTDWRPIPTVGDATGRIFQFRIRLQSLTPNVTPRLFDGSISADMPDRTDSFENLVSSAGDATIVTYDHVFKGPGTSPNVQISIDDAETGDYWSFDYKTLEGFAIRFYDKLDTQVVRQFDVVAKGYGRRHTTTI